MSKKLSIINFKLVTCSFLIYGIYSVIDMVNTWSKEGVQINFGILGIFVFLGLLKHQEGWRKCALAFDWICFIIVPIGLLGLVFKKHLFRYIETYSFPENIFEWYLAFRLSLVIFVIAFWQYKVLNSEFVKKLFSIED